MFRPRAAMFLSLSLLASLFTAQFVFAGALSDELDVRMAKQNARVQQLRSNDLRRGRNAIAQSLLGSRIVSVESRRILCAYEGTGGSIEGGWDEDSFLAKTALGKICLISRCPKRTPIGETFLVNYCN